MCIKCTAPTGATATCDGNACGFDCGGLKACTTAKICVPSDGCCSSAECTQGTNGQTGTCDSGKHRCNYDCPLDTTACTQGTTTTCLGAGACCIDSDCTGTCRTCSASHVCVAATNVADPNGRCAGTCDVGGNCRSKQGQLCTTTAGGCVSGTTCVDRYCCDQACTGSCMACDVAGAEGMCTAVTGNAPPHGARSCGACSGSNFVGGTCSAGACSRSAPQACSGGLVCSGAACLTSCTSSADCQSSYFCQGGACHLQATKICAGGSHTCVLLSDGSVRCWGDNYYGQLGDGSSNLSMTPVAPLGVSGIVGISCGGNYTCAWKADSTVLCWGSNEWGQLGSATNSTVNGSHASSVPVPVSSFRPAGTTVTSVAAGSVHTCALLSDGSVWCWGSDQSLELGTLPTTSVNGNTMCTTTPLKVNGVSAPGGAIALSLSATFVMSSSGAVTAWGLGWHGELGNGSETDSATPIAVAGIAATAIASTGLQDQACAVATATGTAMCWGADFDGEFGNGTSGSFMTTPYAVPNPAGSGASVRALALGDGHICTSYTNGAVWCAGRNDAGQLGATTTGMVGPQATLVSGSATPVRAALTPQVVNALVAGFQHTCALLSDGSVVCWGTTMAGILGNTAPGDFTIAPVAVTPW
jgi:alpha-tubulin suppressor-like RCC1 family protein